MFQLGYQYYVHISASGLGNFLWLPTIDKYVLLFNINVCAPTAPHSLPGTSCDIYLSLGVCPEIQYMLCSV